MIFDLSANRATRRLRLVRATRYLAVPLFATALVAAVIPNASAGAATIARHEGTPSRLYVGHTLGVGGRLISPSGVYAAVVEAHGQIEIEKRGRPVWRSGARTGLNHVLATEKNGAVEIITPREDAHLSGSKTASPSYLSVQNDGDLTLVATTGVPIWQGGLRANVVSSIGVAPYTPGELYGNSNPSVVCYTCEASNITGSAPPSNALDGDSDVDALTGDFSTSNTLFDAPALGGDLSLTLSYDAELAQSNLEDNVASSTEPFGNGWSSNFSDSVSQNSATGLLTTVVNQGDGSEVSFTESNDGGTSTSCQESGDPTTYAADYAGDLPSTSKYTLANSTYQWCALANVQGQLEEDSGVGYTYEQDGGQSIQNYAWSGQLDSITTAAAASAGTPAAATVFYGATGGSTTAPSGVTLAQTCPDVTGDTVTCNYIYASDSNDAGENSDIVEVYLNGSSQVSEVIAPSGAKYTLGYSGTNLTSVGEPSPTGSGTSTWTYAYSSSDASPYSSDLTVIDDPDYGSSTETTGLSSSAHTTTIVYNTGTIADDGGMVTSLSDGTGAATTYDYGYPCSEGQCLGVNDPQETTITYPEQALCPGTSIGCAASVSTSPTEVDVYSAGLETSTQLGNTTSTPEDTEGWTYAWDLGNGTANTTEVVSYPNKLNAIPASATITSDPAGNVVSTTNVLGDIATSAYSDTSNNLNELLWSYPGPSTSAPTNPPSGSWAYTYNAYGQVLTATSPLSTTSNPEVTWYGYYADDFSLLCYVAPPNETAPFIADGATTPPSCTGTATTSSTALPTVAPSSLSSANSSALQIPIGTTTFAYDDQGDITATAIDAGDSGPLADPQTTTSAYDVMGNELWTIPAGGQGDGQSSSNPYARVMTYVPDASYLASETLPGQSTTDYSYDAAGNQTSSTNSITATTSYYDGDNRLCYQVVNLNPSAPADPCSSGVQSQAGSIAWQYEPGSTNIASVTDSNGNPTTYYYGDLAYPNSPTQVDAPGSTQFTMYDDYGNACVTGDVAPDGAAPTGAGDFGSTTAGTTQCSWVSGDTATAYNALGDALSVTDPSSIVTTNLYQDAAYPTAVTSTTAPNGTTTYDYNAAGQLTTTTNPDGTAVSEDYNDNGQVCNEEPTAQQYACGQGPSSPGATIYTYNDAGEVAVMADNSGDPNTPSQWSQTTTYSYSDGQLASTTDGNNQTVSYLYNTDGQVDCEAYPVMAGSSCGTASDPASGSAGNTIVINSYDGDGRLSTVSDWLGNTTTYGYDDSWAPTEPTSVTYSNGTGVAANYHYDSDGNVLGLSAGTTADKSINDVWSYDSDERVSTSTINGVGSEDTAYDGDNQITDATSFGTSVSNDAYDMNANGQITEDDAGSDGATSYSYATSSSGAAVVDPYELCATTGSASAVGCSASDLTSSSGSSELYSYTTNGERSSATTYSGGTPGTTTNYNWNSYGELCSVGPTATATTSASDTSAGCGTTPPGDTGYTYNGDGLRTLTTTPTSTTESAWDTVSGGSIPLNINDATTTTSAPGAITNTSYIYGDLLFGGTAPVEQITTTSSGSSAEFIVSSQTGVAGVYSSSGATLELAQYSTYGQQAITSGTDVTPFGFQGSYTDSTGLIYLINRYYDPATDQFLSIDPDVARTDQPYVFTNDDPLNAEDPTGETMNAGEANLRSGPPPGSASSPCSGPGAPTESQLIGCEDYVITGTPYAPTNSGTTQWSNAATTFGTIFGFAGPLDGAAAFDDIPGLSSDYEYVTTGRSVTNVSTNVTPEEFGANLKNAGWKESTSGDATIYSKDGARYSVYTQSSSTGGPTAAFTPEGAAKATLKIRLGR